MREKDAASRLRTYEYLLLIQASVMMGKMGRWPQKETDDV